MVQSALIKGWSKFAQFRRIIKIWTNSKWIFYLFFSLLASQSFGASELKRETQNLLVEVNPHWVNLCFEMPYTFRPNSEKELIQLHLLNVVVYLERQQVSELTKIQKENRQLNITILRDYAVAGDFPINSTTSFRTPIFIDAHQVHCAVGFLLKENGLGRVAQEIAKKQRLFYLADIEHAQLMVWQKGSGLSLFELALIQPGYGPAIPVCATPSPTEWNDIPVADGSITQLFKSNESASLYGIFQVDGLGLQHSITRFAVNTQRWTEVGAIITGQILDLVFCKDQIYISVFLIEEKFPHQLLKLRGSEWEKVARFDGNIKSIEVLENKLFILGNFTKVNNSIATNFVMVDGPFIKPFSPVGLRHTDFDQIKSSETELFLTSHEMIYQYKNDTLSYFARIQYFEYIPNISLDATKDTLFITSLALQGYNAYCGTAEQSIYFNNSLYGQDYPYRSIHFTKSKKINGKMIVSGDFKSSTLQPRIYENRQLVECADSLSGEWFGEGLLYQYDRKFYPILEEGIVLDFVELNDQIYVLKKNGRISHASISLIEEKIIELREKVDQLKQD